MTRKPDRVDHISFDTIITKSRKSANNLPMVDARRMAIIINRWRNAEINVNNLVMVMMSRSNRLRYDDICFNKNLINK